MNKVEFLPQVGGSPKQGETCRWGRAPKEETPYSPRTRSMASVVASRVPNAVSRM